MTPHNMYTNFLLQQSGKHAVPHSPMEGGVQKVRKRVPIQPNYNHGRAWPEIQGSLQSQTVMLGRLDSIDESGKEA